MLKYKLFCSMGNSPDCLIIYYFEHKFIKPCPCHPGQLLEKPPLMCQVPHVPYPNNDTRPANCCSGFIRPLYLPWSTPWRSTTLSCKSYGFGLLVVLWSIPIALIRINNYNLNLILICLITKFISYTLNYSSVVYI